MDQSSPPWIKRLGYYGFLSAVFMLFRMNRNARKTGVTMKCEIIVGLPWLK